ncbi:MAG: hypothetical protein ACREMY_09515 [bacterium]
MSASERRPVCCFCERNAWEVRHVVDVEGDLIYLECSTDDGECPGSLYVSINTKVTIL